MESADFRKWRKSLDMSQKDAAHALGLKRRMIQYYEKGERNGDKVTIPLTVRLACYAVAQGVEDYRGPQKKVHLRDKNEKPQKTEKLTPDDLEKADEV